MRKISCMSCVLSKHSPADILAQCEHTAQAQHEGLGDVMQCQRGCLTHQRRFEVFEESLPLGPLQNMIVEAVIV